MSQSRGEEGFLGSGPRALPFTRQMYLFLKYPFQMLTFSRILCARPRTTSARTATVPLPHLGSPSISYTRSIPPFLFCTRSSHRDFRLLVCVQVDGCCVNSWPDRCAAHDRLHKKDRTLFGALSPNVCFYTSKDKRCWFKCRLCL